MTPLRLLVGTLAFVLLATGGAHALTVPPAPAPGAAVHLAQSGKGVDVEDDYILRLDPLSAPIMYKGKIRQQLSLVVNLKVSDQSVRQRLVRMMPRLRDAILSELFAYPVVSDEDSGMIDLLGLKERLLDVAKDVGGDDNVQDLFIVTAMRMG